MEILRTIKTYGDGTFLAVVKPKPKVSKTIFRVTNSTHGYHVRDSRDPFVVECFIPQGQKCELLACNVDHLNKCAFVRVKDVKGIEFITFVPIEDLELISGNLGTRAS